VAVATVQFSRAAERALGRPGRRRGRPAGTGLSKLNSMHGLELGEMPRGARGAAAARGWGKRLGRPGSVDVLAARSEAGGRSRGGEGHDAPHDAVPCRPRRAP
jgi:hypothetical protein